MKNIEQSTSDKIPPTHSPPPTSSLKDNCEWIGTTQKDTCHPKEENSHLYNQPKNTENTTTISQPKIIDILDTQLEQL